MIEMTTITGSGFSRQWRPLMIAMYYDKKPPQVRNFLYRINGIVYTERSEEFLSAYKAEVFWWKLQNAGPKK